MVRNNTVNWSNVFVLFINNLFAPLPSLVVIFLLNLQLNSKEKLVYYFNILYF